MLPHKNHNHILSPDQNTINLYKGMSKNKRCVMYNIIWRYLGHRDICLDPMSSLCIYNGYDKASKYCIITIIKDSSKDRRFLLFSNVSFK